MTCRQMKYEKRTFEKDVATLKEKLEGLGTRDPVPAHLAEQQEKFERVQEAKLAELMHQLLAKTQENEGLSA